MELVNDLLFIAAGVSTVLFICYIFIGREVKHIRLSKDFNVKEYTENSNLYYDPVDSTFYLCNSVEKADGLSADFNYKKGYFAYDVDERWAVTNVKRVSKYTEYIGDL